MKWKNFINQPLGSGVSNGYAPKKEIPIAIPLAMAAASAVSSIFGGIFGSSKAREAEERARLRRMQERANTEAERIRAKNQSWTDTASGQNTIRMLNDQARRAWKRTSGAAAVGGATDAAVAIEKEQQNQKQAEIIAQANANFEDKKDNIDASYRQQLANLDQQDIAQEYSSGQQRAANISQVASGVSSALMQGALATFGGTKLGQKWMGTGSPAGGGVSTPSQLQQMGGRYKALSPYIQQYLQGWGTV